MSGHWRAPRSPRFGSLRELSDVEGEVDRVFDAYFGRRARPAGPVEQAWTPPLDVYETKDDLVVSVELPGVREQDVRLSITGDVLSLRGQRGPNAEIADEHYYRIERWSGTFERHVQLPVPVQADHVRASYKDGVLEVRLPKVVEVKPREIRIEIGQGRSGPRA